MDEIMKTGRDLEAQNGASSGSGQEEEKDAPEEPLPTAEVESVEHLNDTHKVSTDAPNPEEYDERAAKFWSVYVDEAEHHDKALIGSWKDDMEGVIVFAGLYSASLTAFLVESYKNLAPDPVQVNAYYTRQSVVLLAQISAQLAASGSPVPSAFDIPLQYPEFHARKSRDTTTENPFMEAADLFSTRPTPFATAQIISLIRTSLGPLPATKPRIVHSAGSPHEILVLIRDVGVDLFDAHWAQRAADVGVALDFVFPVPPVTAASDAVPPPPREIGHNLYDKRYSHDFSPFADALRSCAAAKRGDTRPSCPCMACSPLRPSEPLKHSSVDEALPVHTPMPYTRAYVHHLLHTHEMSAHTLLALHNLAVLDTLFAGVRRVLSERPEQFPEEITRFGQAYDERLGVLAESRKDWNEVTLARGRGRLVREREKQKQDALETAVELE